MKKTILTTLILLSAFICRGQGRIDTLFVSTLYTTTLVFDTDLNYVNVSNMGIIQADIPKTLKNLVVMKARNTFEETASLTAVENNGRIHTFIIANNEHPRTLTISLKAKPKAVAAEQPAQEQPLKITGQNNDKKVTPQRKGRTQEQPAEAAEQAAPQQAVAAATDSDEIIVTNTTSDEYVSAMRKADAPKLNQVIDMPQGYYHLSARSQRITAVCENIFAYSDITYMVLSLDNQSGVSFEASEPAFTIESHNKGKRKIENKINITPKNRYGNISAAPGEKGKIAFTFDKITLSDDQVFKIHIYENGGQRNLIITVDPKDINCARRPM